MFSLTGHDDHVKRIHLFVDEAQQEVWAPLDRALDRFPSVLRLTGPIREISERLAQMASPRDPLFDSQVSALREKHNEACVALDLLESDVLRLDYEPAPASGRKRIDFRVLRGDGTVNWVEVKTIHPTNADKWENYRRVKAEGLFPERVQVLLARGGLGGEIWHHMMATREKMLDYSLETEDKIASVQLDARQEKVTLAFCGGGYRWRDDELEDFATFYFTGAHRDDDPFMKMEAHYIAQKQIQVKRTISCFGYVERPSFSARPVKRLTMWSEGTKEGLW